MVSIVKDSPAQVEAKATADMRKLWNDLCVPLGIELNRTAPRFHTATSWSPLTAALPDVYR